VPLLIRPGRFLPIRCKQSTVLLILLLLLASIGLDAAGLGYALSGGGARGFAHIGILKVLEEQGVYPDQISGTSIGAIVGAGYAMGYSASELERLLLDLDIMSLLDDRYERQNLYIGQKRWPSHGNLTLNMGQDWWPRLPSSIFIANRLNLAFSVLASPAAPYREFSQFPVPYSCVATDLGSGEMMVFSQGSLMQAMRASMSVPSLVKPFSLGGRYYIDGGVSQNLPIPQARELGADAVIGFKVNTDLRDAEKLNDVIDIIDQTISIGMSQNIRANLGDCDLLLEPDLDEWVNTRFGDAAELIAVGEAYARANLDRITAFRDSLLAAGHVFKRPGRLPDLGNVRIQAIATIGNRHVSRAKIVEYLGLEAGSSYTPRQIAEACHAAWNSQAFEHIYPVLIPGDGGFMLEVHVRERERRFLTLNLAYTSEEELNVQSTLTLNNLILKNSKLLAGITLGGRTEVNLDYVKNFGEFWGSYFRIYPWLSENSLYLYDADHYKIGKVRKLEFGIAPGIGVFAHKLAIAEAFAYSYRTRLYRDISDTAPIDSLYLISGVGVKLYHESLDDDVFPRAGIRAFTKANFARWEKTSDQIYSRLIAELDLYSRLADFASLRLGLDYGSYFGAEDESSIDPFHFSGSQGYRGYERYAVSSPQYRVYTLGLVFNPLKNLFFEAGFQGLNISPNDGWGTDQDVMWCLYGDLGYRTMVGPVRLITAIRENSRPQLYLNIGFDTDLFWFSRK